MDERESSIVSGDITGWGGVRGDCDVLLEWDVYHDWV